MGHENYGNFRNFMLPYKMVNYHTPLKEKQGNFLYLVP